MFIYCNKNLSARKTAGISTNAYVHNREYNRFSTFITVAYNTGNEDRVVRMAHKITRAVSDRLILGASFPVEDIFDCTDETELSHIRMALFNSILKAAASADANVDLSELNMAVAVVDRETEKAYCFSFKNGAVRVRTADETRLYTKGDDGMEDIHIGGSIQVFSGNSDDSIEIKIYPDINEKEKLYLYTAQRCSDFHKSNLSHSRAVAYAIMAIAMDRTRQKSTGRLSICGTYANSIHDGIRKTVPKLYSDQQLRQFVEFSIEFAQTGEGPQHSTFEEMAENLLEHVPVIAAKRNPMFKFLDD